MNKQQFDNVNSLEPEKRFHHFIGKVADWEEVWTLKNQDGFVMMGNKDGKVSLPFWPHPEYAAVMASDEFEGCDPEMIELSSFMEKWLPGMAKDGRTASIFPVPNTRCVVIDPLELLGRLKAECEQYE